jgi:hypothetical protein
VVPAGAPPIPAGLTSARRIRTCPERVIAATEEAFHLRFLAQSAVPGAQMTTVGDTVHLVDVTTGSAAAHPHDGGWSVWEGGPARLWERIEHVLDAYAPGPETITLHVYDGGQHPRRPQMAGCVR